MVHLRRGCCQFVALDHAHLEDARATRLPEWDDGLMKRGIRGEAGVTGIAAGAATLGTAGVLAAGLVRTWGSDGTPSPLLAVAGAFVDLTPAWLKDLAVSLFGTADKLVLLIGMGVVLTIVCAAIGLLTHRNGLAGSVAFALVGALGLAAVLSRPGAATQDAAPTIAGTVVGLVVLTRLTPHSRYAVSERAHSSPLQTPGEHSRRRLLLTGGAVTALGVLGIAAGRMLSTAGEAVRAAREALVIPGVARPVTIPGGAEQGVTGQTAYVTANDGFYRIDTAITVPQVDPETWRLRVHGMVEQEVEIDLAELLQQDLVEALVTLTCVSNEVGGDLAGNAVWTGWPVRELLARAGPLPGADMVLSTSADGWTAGTPLEVLTDERNALIAVAMNGEPLPPEHGFPVRLVVPGLYGYVSATKWVVELKVTRFADDVGYWTPRGWSERGPIKTAARIDVPRREVDAGPTAIAGVAWAQHRGIQRVEVRIDDGEWQEATLAEEPSVDSWRQWMLPWDAAPGDHTLTARATDGEGDVQTDEHAPPAPNGASGWHAVDVSVHEH